MNSISAILQKKYITKKKALIPFITAGYPSSDFTVKALLTLDSQGADIIELGIPYSDALADGFLIQESSKIALQQGIYLTQVLYILEKIKFKLNSPIIIFTYYNPVLVRGVNKFIKEIYLLGVKGLIIPDLPLEEINYISYLCINYKIELILFISPTSSYDRILKIVSKAPGCIYLVSKTGVTGIKSYLNNNINILSSYIKFNTNKSLILGFGISSSSQVSYISKWKNISGIVMGSAFIQILLYSYINKEHNLNMINKLSDFCKQMKRVIEN
uniref:Tryptophan synthase alpha chain n=1 Tax=Choreocolax polysiphoniae TaxID=282351 RepID=A0A0B5W5K4_9FLOR|nr:tryptophan synthase alpha chain [Choreocolax polysiphoniae]AJH65876.1 tryptophan synthase alpha chain [Choreocolax polysiphoniae]